MISGISIPLCDELTLECKEGEMLPPWAVKLEQEVKEAVEEQMHFLNAKERVNVEIKLYVNHLPPEDVRMLLETAIQNGIMYVMDKYYKEDWSLHCSYNFFNKEKRVEIEIF